MFIFKYIRGLLFARQVSASNTTKSACAKRKDEPDVTPAPSPVDFMTIVEQVTRCRDEAEKVLGALGGDETLLVRADYQLALMRLFAWLKNPDDSCDLKDIVASIQKLASLKKAAGDDDSEDTNGENAGVPPEVLAEIHADMKLL